MTKKKSTPVSALAQTVPHGQWTRIRAAERITYDDGAPDRARWQNQPVYAGGELSYRGRQERRPIVSLAGRPL